MPLGHLIRESALSNKPIWIVGTGGHAKSLASTIESRYDQIVFIAEDSELRNNSPGTVPESKFISEGDVSRSLVNGVGVVQGNAYRKQVTEKYESLGYEFVDARAESAITSSSSTYGSGVQLFHNTFVGNQSILNDHVVLGTGSIVEHDSQIGTGAFVGPGVTICGEVELGDWCFIGAGTVISPGTIVPRGKFIKAGSLITPKSDHR
jgi:UDP-3-O-[3-hydroxymyristoyl] glucosamine N-acyltransferase